MASANQVIYELKINADTTEAKKQIQDLQNSLTKVSTTVAPNSFKAEDYSKAAKAASELQQHLAAAVNTDTGKLNLNKFNASINASKKTFQELTSDLVKAGPAGTQAFNNLSRSIATASTQGIQLSNTMSNFLRTMKNVAKYQLSTSVWREATSLISSAYNYAQDLNESLNNIRIVTGQTTSQMADFAEQANKAAQALSTTTTKYTDAALIFYQQGLTGSDVTERTDAVIKMANVTKDSVTEVSSYMTAIWNNFDNGTETLEHYEDVITALGATTASSSAEIAAGLEKFASVGQTIGLSYDYATSALATIVANTRQSADTVGTSLKTIFSRLQGLSLGETLDDGTTLNKYSKALNVVGVSIKDAEGNLRDMDDILDDLGSKWETLSRDEQTALAQTVAGTRQYTQLVSLMDNWDDMKDNLTTAANSDGTLQEQADIYAESWDAAKNRVTASLEEVYSKLLNDKAFIKITDYIADIIKGVSAIIDGMGGLPGILLQISAILTKIMSRNIDQNISRMVANVKNILPSGKKETTNIQNTMVDANKDIAKNSTSQASQSQARGIEILTKTTQKYNSLANRMTDAEKAKAERIQQTNLAIYDQIQAQAALIDAQNKAMKKEQQTASSRASVNGVNEDLLWSDEDEKQLNTYDHQVGSEKRGITGSGKVGGDGPNKDQNVNRGAVLAKQKELEEKQEKAISFRMNSEDPTQKTYLKAGQTAANQNTVKQAMQYYKDQVTELKKVQEANEKVSNAIEEIGDTTSEEFGQGTEEVEEFRKKVEEAKKALQDFNPDINLDDIDTTDITDENGNVDKDKANGIIEKLQQAQETNIGGEEDSIQERVNNIKTDLTNFANNSVPEAKQAMQSFFTDVDTQADSMDSLNEQFERLEENSNEISHTTGVGETIMSGVSALSTGASVATTAIGIFDTFNDESTTLYTKISSLIAILPTLITLITSLTSSALGPWGIAIAAVGVGIVALTKYIDSQESSLEKAQAEYEAVTTAANNLAESLSETEDQLETLSTSYEGYETLLDEINECKKGTDEWYDKLAEINDLMSQLEAENSGVLDMYSDSHNGASPWEYTEDGFRVLTKDAQEWLEEYTNTASKVSVVANNYAKEAENNAEVTVDEEQFKEDARVSMGNVYRANRTAGEKGIFNSIDTNDTLLDIVATAVANPAKEEASIESQLRNMDEATEQEITALALSTSPFASLDEYKKAYAEADEEKRQAMLTNYGINGEGHLTEDALTNVISDLEQVVNGFKNPEESGVSDGATTNARAYYQEKDQSGYKQEDVGLSQDQTNTVTSLVGQMQGMFDEKYSNVDVTDIVNTYGEEIYDGFQGIIDGMSEWGSEDLFAEYQKYNAEASSGTYDHTDEDGTIHYLDEDNNDQTITPDMAKGTIAAAKWFSDGEYKTQVEGYYKEFATKYGQGTTFSNSEINSVNTVTAAVDKIISKLEMGEEIESTDYQTIIDDLGEDFSRFFVETKDGTYQLVASAEELQEAADKVSFDKLEENYDDLIAKNNEIDTKMSLHYNGWDKMSTEDKVAMVTQMENNPGAYSTADKENFTVRMGYSWDENDEDQQAEAFQLACENYLELQTQIANTGDTMATYCTKLTELNNLNSKGSLSSKTYSKQLKLIASQYSSCQTALNKYNKVLETYGEDSAEAKQAQKELTTSITKAEWSEATKNLSTYVTELQTAKAAGDTLAEQEVYEKLKEDFNTAFGTEFSTDVIQKNWSNLLEWQKKTGKEAVEYSSKLMADMTLETAANNDTYMSSESEGTLNERVIDLKINVDPNSLTDITDMAQTARELIAANPAILSVDSVTGEVDYTELANQLLAIYGDAQKVCEMLGSIPGVDTDSSFNVIVNTPSGSQFAISNVGFDYVQRQIDSGNQVLFGNYSFKGTGSTYTPTTTGGGGSSSTVKKSDEIDRYIEITEDINDLKDALEDLQNASNHYSGDNLVDNLEKQEKVINDLIDDYKEYQEEINTNLNGGNNTEAIKALAETIGFDLKWNENGTIANKADFQEAIETYQKNGGGLSAGALSASESITNDKQALADMAAAIGFTDLKFTDDGDIANETDFRNALFDYYYEKDAESGEYKLKDSDKSDEYSRYKELIDTYNETLDLAEEAKDQIQEYIYQLAEILNKKVEAISTKWTNYLDNYQKREKDVLEDAVDDAADAIEDAFGGAQLTAIKDAITALENQNKAYSNDVTYDKKAIEEIVEELNTNYGSIYKDWQVKTDAEGNIINYDELYVMIWEIANIRGKAIDDAQQAYAKAFLEELEKVEDWQEKLDTSNDNIKDNTDKIKDYNYQLISNALKNKTQITSNNDKLIDAQIKILGDSVYRQSEIVALYAKKEEKIATDLKAYDDAVTEAKKQLDAGEITSAKYGELLQEAFENCCESIESYIELQDEMTEYYKNFLTKVGEELETFTKHIESLTKALDYYSQLITLTGKSQDYALRKQLAAAQTSAAKNEYSTAQGKYNLYSKRKSDYEASAADSNSDLYKALGGMSLSELLSTADDKLTNTQKSIKDTYKQMISDVDEAYSSMLEKAVAWAEKIQAEVTVAIEEAAAAYEEAFTGDLGWDTLSSSIEHASTMAEEYLTNTNKIYETDKMLRNISKEIDKTDNAASKRKYQAFAKEIKQLQEKDKLSNLELQIAQGKYEILKAQIALEEAQNAKSTVRMVKDSEGNYGYVYTANQDDIDDAEQNLADKENDLYNTELDAVNDYNQKKQKIAQETEKAIEELETQRNNNEITAEQFEARKAEIIKNAEEEIQMYSDLTAIAQADDANVVADAWTNAFSSMTFSIDEFEDNMDAFLDKIDDAFENKSKQMADFEAAVGTSTDNLTNSISDVADESEEFANTVTEDVIPALEDEMEALEKNEQAWLAVSAAIDKAVSSAKTAASTMNTTLTGLYNSTSSDSTSGTTTTTEDSTTTTSESTDENAFAGTKNDVNYLGLAIWLSKRGWSINAIDTKIGSGYQEKTGHTDSIGTTAEFYIVKANQGDTSYKGSVDWVASCSDAWWQSQLDLFDTGGYTGEWGIGGKLAMLHQKELVLNADDTENMLAIVDMVRQIANNLTGDSYSSLLSSMNTADLTYTNADSTLEQNVHIEASFPGVTDHNEIELALNDLINKASQYANRK